MGITLYGNGNGPYSSGNKFPSADAVFSLCNSNVQFLWHLLFIMTILLLITILLHLIETVRFSDKLSTTILYVSRVFDTPKMFMPQWLNVCLGMGMGWEGMGIALWEYHGNGNWLQNWEWEWEGVGIDHIGMGGNGNVKSHSRSSLHWTQE